MVVVTSYHLRIGVTSCCLMTVVTSCCLMIVVTSCGSWLVRVKLAFDHMDDQQFNNWITWLGVWSFELPPVWWFNDLIWHLIIWMTLSLIIEILDLASDQLDDLYFDYWMTWVGVWSSFEWPALWLLNDLSCRLMVGMIWVIVWSLEWL